MNNVLFVPSVQQTAWLSEILPGMGLAELPVAGKRIVEYWIESAAKYDVAMIEILDCHWSQALSRFYSDLTAAAFPVFCSKLEGEAPRGLRELEKISSPLTQNINDDLVVVWGLCLTGHCYKNLRLTEVGESDLEATPPGVYRRKGGRWMRVRPDGLKIRDVKSWHKMNFAVMHERGEFTLPGYSAEAGVHLGRNVVLEHGTEVKPPVIIQDDTWCARNVLLEGDVIIGNGSFISEGARLKRTVVGANTYIGSKLELVDKIVIGKRVIDSKTGVWTDIEEAGVARDLSEHAPGLGTMLRSLWRFFIGRSHGGRR